MRWDIGSAGRGVGLLRSAGPDGDLAVVVDRTQQVRSSVRAVLVAALAAAVAASCSRFEAPAHPTSRPPAGLDLFMPVPPAAISSPEVVELGRRLFFDPVLSRDSSLACASCHRPVRAFADGRKVSVGVSGRRGTRNVPTLINRGWGRSFFWDGRIVTLEEQVLQPIIAPAELDMSVEAVVRRLRADRAYRERFRRAFGGNVDREALAGALAAYVRSIRAGGSPFDRAMAGEMDALSGLERRGLELFQGRARCDRCHSGALLSDEMFHNTGVAWRNGEPSDSGRAHVTGRSEDVGAFKTPTLREIPLTAPYMHDGSLATLEDIVEFYDAGGHPNPYLDPVLQPLGLAPGEKQALRAFLGTLQGGIEAGGRTIASRGMGEGILPQDGTIR